MERGTEMTDKERIAWLETRLQRAFVLIHRLHVKLADVTGATKESIESLKTDQDIIKEMVFGLWQREGVEPINAWMDAEDRLKEEGQ